MVTSKACRREEAVAVGLGLLDFFSAGPNRNAPLGTRSPSAGGRGPAHARPFHDALLAAAKERVPLGEHIPAQG